MFNYARILKEILDTLKSLYRLQHREIEVLLDVRDDVREILALIEPKTLTAGIAVRFTGANMDNALVFTVGQTSQASIMPFLADGITPSGGALSSVLYTFSDPSATVVINSDGLTATCTAVAASGGPIAGSATCTVTDTDGAVSQWTQAFTIATNAVVPPAQLTQSVAVQFSVPTP